MGWRPRAILQQEALAGEALRPPSMLLDPPPPPSGITLSPDGLWAATATESGALSLLDVASRRYTSLLRTHTAAVHAAALMAQLPGEPQRYCTAGADGTVRVWDASSHQQLLELTAPGETVLRQDGCRLHCL